MPDREVAIVGGGPSGAAAAVFTARQGLDTVVFDRGNAALDHCAYLENYPGFPGGIRVDVFQDLLSAHVSHAGADLVAERVETVQRTDSGAALAVETDEGRRMSVENVIAAAWYDASYLRGLDEPAMFETVDHHGDAEERLDPEYADPDGRTPIEGLYVASPAGERSAQAVVAAGNGAHVARTLMADRRRDRGLRGDIAPVYDWRRTESAFTGEWGERDRWEQFFDREMAGTELSDERRAELQATYVDRAFGTRTTEGEVADRFERGVEMLVRSIGHERVLDAMPDEQLRAYMQDSGGID
jgi:hypothetical protein